MPRRCPGLFAVAFALSLSPMVRGETLDLSTATIVALEEKGPARTAATMLAREVEARTGLRWPVKAKVAEGAGPRVVVGVRPAADHGAEGYLVETDAAGAVVTVSGNDPRGAVFGVGRLLRELRYARGGDGRGSVSLAAGFRVESAPKVALRGHQLGYRPKTNSYDAWDLPQWERYIGEMAAFGTNAVELVPPRTDDDDDSPHFPLPKLEMMAGMSKILDDYGMDVWVWFPVMYSDIGDPKQIEAGLKEWEDVFKALPRVNAVFVPGGDPGHTPPKPLFAFMEKATELMHKYHPKAGMWVSPQGFNAQGSAEFMELVKARPTWLAGLVFGPQVRIPLAELRKITPENYPIRGYPDITHSRQCQHPVQDWDLAYAVTEGRESINPRPHNEARIFSAYKPLTNGFLTYSEGCNDDVNKFVWSGLGWDPDADVGEILRQYSRYLVGDPEGDRFARVLFGLERNWKGPLLTNEGVETTLRQIQDLERAAPSSMRRNWRFQQALYRGYYDAYLRDRLRFETTLEARALEELRQAPRVGSQHAMRHATVALERFAEPISADRRARVFELAKALFQSIRMQLSKPKYLAIDPERGANLDTIDTPLNNRLWLENEFARIRTISAESERLTAIDALLNWTDPGPGGYYDDLGDLTNSPRLVRSPGFHADPMLVRSAYQGFALRSQWPLAWRRYVQTFHDAPIHLEYHDLDPTASYKVKVTYAGDNTSARMALKADDAIEIHGLIAKPNPPRPLAFPVPRAATADGKLRLTWSRDPGSGGNGRGCQVSQVWLIRE